MDRTIRNRFTPKIQSITLISPKEQRLNPSRSSSAEQRKIKFTQNISYYKSTGKDDRSLSDNRSKVLNSDNESFDVFQQKAKFIDYSEFNIINVGEQIVAISYFYPEDYAEQLKERFDERLEETKTAIKRRFPFIQLLLKPLANSAETSYGKDQPKKPYFEVQSCSYIINQKISKTVIYSMAVSNKLPKSSTILANIQRTLRNVDLVVELDCGLKDVQLIGPQQDNHSLLEGLQVSIRQRTGDVLPSSLYKDGKLDTSKVFGEQNSSQYLSKINIPSLDTISQDTPSMLRSSSRSNSQKKLNLSQSKSNKSITFSTRSSRLVMQTSIFLNSKQTSRQDERSRSGSKNDSLLNQSMNSPTDSYQSPLKKNQPIRVYTQKAITNQQGCAVLKNIPLDIEEYCLEISGSRELKYFKQTINLKSLYEQQNDGILKVCFNLQREDLCNGNITVTQSKVQIGDASVKIGNYEFWKNDLNQQTIKNLWFQEIDCNQELNSYCFFSAPGSYFIEVNKEGCFTERKQMHFKRGQLEMNINLTQSTLVKLTLKTKNLITQELVGDFNLRVVDEKENEIWNQPTDSTGVTAISISLMKQVRVYVERENYVSVFQDIALSADALEHDIFVIPQNENVKNRLDILIHEPHEEFNLNYQLICPGFNPVNQHNTSNMVYGASYDFIKFKNGGRIIGISVQQLNAKNFEVEAFSILQKPNVKESFQKQMFTTFNQKDNKDKSMNMNDENDFTFLDMYSKTLCYPESTKQQKYEEHQKVGRNFCQAVQSIDGYFYNQRLQTTPLKYQKNLKEYVYVNQQLQKYTPEKSARVYVIFDNKLLNVSYINQNIFLSKRSIGYFDHENKTFVDKLQSCLSQQPVLQQTNNPLNEQQNKMLLQQQQQQEPDFKRKGSQEMRRFKDTKEAKFYGINKTQTKQRQQQQQQPVQIQFKRF